MSFEELESRRLLALLDFEQTNPDGHLTATDDRFAVEAKHSVTAVVPDNPAMSSREERNWFTGVANYKFETPKALVVDYKTAFQYSRPSPLDFPLRGNIEPFSASVQVFQRSPEVGYKYRNYESRIDIEVDEADSFNEDYYDSVRRILQPGEYYVTASALTRALAGKQVQNGRLAPFGTGMTSASSTSVDLRFLDVGDLVADEIEYVNGDTFAEDRIELKYQIRAADLSDPVFVGLYWSTDGNFSSDLPLAGRWQASETGVTSVLAQSISRPSEEYRYLVMQLDDDNRVEEPNENNNSQSLEIDPTFDIESMEWIAASEGGGLKVTYDVNQPAFLPVNMTGSIVWQESGGLAFSDFSVSLDTSEQVFAGADFLAPEEGDKTIELTIVGATTQIHETHELEYRAPTTEFVSSQEPERKSPYDVRVDLTNNLPVPLQLDLRWDEWDNSVLFDILDVETNNPINVYSGPVSQSGNTTELVVLPGETEKLSLWGGPLNRSWDWIPATNPVENEIGRIIVDAIGSIRDEGLVEAIEHLLGRSAGEIFKTLFTVQDIAVALTPPKPLYSTASILYPLKIDPRVSTVDDIYDEFSLQLVVPKEREEDLTRYQMALVSSVLSLNAGVMSAQYAPQGLPALALGYAISIKLAEQAYDQAIDPPDRNFTQVAPVENPDSIWDEVASGFNRVDVGENAVNDAVLDAMARTRDKSLGANIAGNLYWEARQRQVLSRMADRLVAIESRRILASTLQADYLTANASNWRDIKESVRVDGLDRELTEQLESYGIAPEVIEALAQGIILSPDNHFEDADSILASERLGSFANLQTAFNDFVTSIRLKVVNGATVNAGNSSGLDQKLSEIDEALDRNLASAELLVEIQRFIAEVKERLNQSNDLEELQPFLESAYFALFSFQQLSVTPNALMDFIDRGVNEGRIASDVRSVSDVFVSEANSLVATGDMDGAILKLGELAAEIQNFESGLLSEDDKTAISDFVSLQNSLRFFNWHNHLTPLDVNDDGLVSPIDALLVINRLNSAGGGRGVPDAPSIHLLDTNNDSFVSPIDALLVINELNRSHAGEGELTIETIHQVNLDQYFLSGFLEDLPKLSFPRPQTQRSAATNTDDRYQRIDYIASDQTTFSAPSNSLLSEHFGASEAYGLSAATIDFVLGDSDSDPTELLWLGKRLGPIFE